MGTSINSNVVAFPLSQSEQLKPSRKFVKFENGKIVACETSSAETITIEEARARLRARPVADPCRGAQKQKA